MATKGRPKRRPKDDWTPPRGIRYVERKGRRSPFLLEWREDGRRRAQAFESAAAREAAAQELAAKRERHGHEIFDFDPRAWRKWQEFQALVKGADPIVVAHEWLRFRQGTTAAGAEMTVAEAVGRYLELRQDEALTADTWRHIRKHLQSRFAGMYGDRLLREVDPDLIRAWLGALVSDRTGAPAESITRRHHRKDLNTFLKRCVAEGWILRNPCEAVKPPSFDEEDVTVMPVEDVAALFAANRDQPCVGRLALEAFGGLRYSSAARVQTNHINFDERGISMPGPLHKSRKRQYRQGQPENLWLWLQAAPAACWAMSVRQYLAAKRDAFVRAGVDFPRNILRHSFASYHLALHKNPPLTAYLMQHTRTKTTAIYEGVAREADAGAYFAISP